MVAKIEPNRIELVDFSGEVTEPTEAGKTALGLQNGKLVLKVFGGEDKVIPENNQAYFLYDPTPFPNTIALLDAAYLAISGRPAEEDVSFLIVLNVGDGIYIHQKQSGGWYYSYISFVVDGVIST